MHRFIIAGIPLAIFLIANSQAATAPADSLAEHKLAWMLGTVATPQAAPLEPMALSGVPLREAKHLRGRTQVMDAPAPNGLSSLWLAKRHVRVG
jgi:hypothetical protein